MTKEYVLDGTKITSLENFYEEIGGTLIPGVWWGENLDAFNDILRGGFGTPDEGFVIRWKDSEVSRANLSYAETTRQLEKRLERCHPTNREVVRADLLRAQHGEGPTVFDWVVDIMRDHDANGEQAHDQVRIILD